MPRRLRFLSTTEKIDKTLFILILTLTVIGIMAVADASAPQALRYFNDSYFYVKQQVVWAIFGLLGMLVISRIHYSVWKRYATVIFIISIVALFAVLIPGIGSKFLGARRWIVLGPASFQPSELVKFSVALFFARLADSKKELKSYIVTLALVAGLIMLQPDLGTTIIVVGIGFLQLFIAGVPLLSIISVVGAGAIGALALIMTSEYRRARLMTFLGMGEDRHGIAYHITQVLIALGSGGIFGVGLGQSRQKYLFLPESATDSVFAVISEEIGFIGSLLLIFLFLAFIYKGMSVVARAPDKFSQMLAVGIVSWIAVQFFLNLSSMVALTPLTGVPLPFFSYGGSSLTTILFSLGILLNISRYSK